MGSRVLEFAIGGTTPNSAGGVLLVEIDDPQEIGNRPVSRNMVEKARQSLEAALMEVMPGVSALMQRCLQEIPVKPDEFALEFGIKFTAEAGALIAKTTAEGNIKVAFKWNSPK
jgi:hypothetical protein